LYTSWHLHDWDKVHIQDVEREHKYDKATSLKHLYNNMVSKGSSLRESDRLDVENLIAAINKVKEYEIINLVLPEITYQKLNLFL
jgi:hypothetical protein